MSQTKLDVRGFHIKDAASCNLLETIGETFLTGYSYAAEARFPFDAEKRLETVAPRFRGFAYEGAAMGFAVRDGLPGGSGRNVAGFLAGRGDAHVYMVYVGVGWAMARLPRFRWSRLHAPDPLLRWLVLDGYGFHQAYFRTRRYVHEHYREPRFPWPADGPHGYADRVIDQGIGRASWFVGGADARQVAKLLDAFPEPRRPDLYSGAGLAATYAGGVDQAELRWFFDHAGAYRPQVAQGSAFAAGARVRAGLVVPHVELATEVFCGMTATEAWQVTERALPQDPAAGPEPGYELWRQHIANHLVSRNERSYQ
jgi:enediyne biosynthesis protein E3